MAFYSGFCLQNEEVLFHEYLPMFGDYIAGFSYGAIKAIQHAINDKSVKKLLLLSPAYYSHKDDSFKKTQSAAFAADPLLYKIKLLKRSGLSEDEGKIYGKDGTQEELNELLFFDWEDAGVGTLLNRGVEIEVFIGDADRVVEPNASKEFFERFAKVYVLENKNHILR